MMPWSERDDEWGKNVESQLLGSNDLVTEEAIYHKACIGKFCLSKISVYEKPGRPINTEIQRIRSNLHLAWRRGQLWFAHN